MAASAFYNRISSTETEEDDTKVVAVEVPPADDACGNSSKYGKEWDVDLSGCLLPEPGTIPEEIPEKVPEDPVVCQAAQTLVDMKADTSRVTISAIAELPLVRLLAAIADEPSGSDTLVEPSRPSSSTRK